MRSDESPSKRLQSLRVRLKALMISQPDMAALHATWLEVLNRNESAITQDEIDLMESTLREM